MIYDNDCDDDCDDDDCDDDDYGIPRRLALFDGSLYFFHSDYHTLGLMSRESLCLL